MARVFDNFLNGMIDQLPLARATEEGFDISEWFIPVMVEEKAGLRKTYRVKLGDLFGSVSIDTPIKPPDTQNLLFDTRHVWEEYN